LDFSYKFSRVRRWAKRIGLLNAIGFELQQTIRRPVIAVRHPGIHRRIFLRRGSSDISVFEHVFINDEFDIELESPALIVDGGANCGLASVYFATRYPAATVIAIEPDSANCAIARRNVEGLNVEVIESALWSSQTALRIEDTDSELWAFRCVEADPDEPGAFEAFDMASILAGRSCDLVKLDIEGAEVELFKDPVWLDKVAALTVEIHSEEADHLIREACRGWQISRSGEKLTLRKQKSA